MVAPAEQAAEGVFNFGIKNAGGVECRGEAADTGDDEGEILTFNFGRGRRRSGRPRGDAFGLNLAR